MNPISIAIHGGSGRIEPSSMTPEKEKMCRDTLQQVVRSGYTILEEGKSALDAVEQAVRKLEDSPLFNAGKGSVFYHSGEHEMDAAIMDGKYLKAGSVALVKRVKNPISLARLVMEKTSHVMLAGEGAIEFAHSQDCEFRESSYFFDEFRRQQWLDVKDTDATKLDHSDMKMGTVGAVALDKNGNLASATSTGGMTNKKYGRIGDSPIIGSGTYADNRSCAVSATGRGEYFMRSVAAYDVSCLMSYKGLSLGEACEKVIHDHIKSLGGEGGLIAADTSGHINISFNTEGMYRAAKKSDGTEFVSIYKEEARK